MAPPLRFVSAAMWLLMQRKDVLQYGKLAEFVTLVSEAVPGLLSYRHWAKLTLGLRARFILELCRTRDPPDPTIILPELERVKPPLGNKRDKTVEFSASNFRQLVRNLLDSPAERETFFQEAFVVQYGPQFDSELEKLNWEFLSGLDQLLPFPDLAQLASWLSSAPSVLEDCVQSVSQPALLNTLSQHRKRLGHQSTTVALPSSSMDSILSSLSLPLSGRVRSPCKETLDQSSVGPDSLSRASLTHPANHRRGSGSPIQPVIGLITNKDLPLMPCKSKGMEAALATPIISKEAESGGGSARPLYTVVELPAWASFGRGGACQEGAEEGRTGGGGENGEGLRKRGEPVRQEKMSQREDGSTARTRPQEVEELSPLVISCLQRRVRPRVRLERLNLADISPFVLPLPRRPASPQRGCGPGTRKRKLNATPERENSESLMLGMSPVLSLKTSSGVALPSSSMDSIFSSLSLPLSGRVRSPCKETNSLDQSSVGPDSLSRASLTHPANHRRGSGSPIQPVIGLITNKDLPLMPCKSKGMEAALATPIISKEAESGGGSARPLYTVVELPAWASFGRGGACQEGAEEGRTGGGGENGEGLRKRGEPVRQEKMSQREDGSTARTRPQEVEELSPLVISCLQRRPIVRLERLNLADISPFVLPLPRRPASPQRGCGPGTRKRKLNATPERENSESLMLGMSPVLSLKTSSGVALPSSSRDSILSSLSLPLSGRVRSPCKETNSLDQSRVGPDSLSRASLTHPANHRQGSGSPIQPVIGLITNKDLPLMPCKSKGMEAALATPIISKEAESGGGSARPLYTVVELPAWASFGRGGACQEGAEEGRTGGGGENGEGLRKRGEPVRQEKMSQREDGSTACTRPQEVEELSPLVISCLQRRPIVRLERLNLADISPFVLPLPRRPASPQRGCGPGTRKRKLNATPERENSESLMLGMSPVLSLKTRSGDSDSLHPDCDDIIIDSDDDEIRNVKGRLFVKQYYRTKNNTFVPTLREFCGHTSA